MKAPVLSSVLLVDNHSALDRFHREWLPRIHDAVVALDIEEERGHTYHPRVALLQLTVDGEDAILDPIVLGTRLLEPTIEQVLLTARTIIVHGGRNDVSGLRRDFGVGPHQLADTQIAARFIGARQFGLSALLEERFRIVLNKETRRSDWAQRPLSATQLDYARNDTHYLEPLWQTLLNEAHEAGWGDAVQEECDALGAVPAETSHFDPMGWMKIKGMSTRADSVRMRAAQLWAWRDRFGEEHNVHPSQAIPSWALEQAAIRGENWLLTQNSVVSRLRQVDPDAIDQLQQYMATAHDLPITRPREHRELNLIVGPDALRQRHDALSEWRNRVAEETGIEPGWLAPRSVLEDVAKSNPRDLEQLHESSDVRQWRLRRYISDWDEILRRYR